MNSLLELTGAPFIVVANVVAVATGDRNAVGLYRPNDLVDTLFGDSECVSALNLSLEGQLMPRMWRQGRVLCIVCKPAEDTIVGVFSADDHDVSAQYQWSKKLAEKVAAVLGGGVGKSDEAQ